MLLRMKARCAGHIERTISVGKHEGANHLEDLGLDGTIILKWLLVK